MDRVNHLINTAIIYIIHFSHREELIFHYSLLWNFFRIPSFEMIHYLTFFYMATENAMILRRIAMMETGTGNENVVYSRTVIVFFSTNFLIKTSICSFPAKTKYNKVRKAKCRLDANFARGVCHIFICQPWRRKID